MTRFLWGGLVAVLLGSAGLFWWSSAARDRAVAGVTAPAAAPAGTAAPPADAAAVLPPVASEQSREQRRFSRYDKDRNGAVGREEYLASRRKAFAKLDTNGDGKLEFEEYAAKSIAKFGAADANRDGSLNPAEFATTRVVRKPHAVHDCPPDRTRERSGAADDEG